MMKLLLVSATAFLISLWTVRLVRGFALRHRIGSLPTARRIHTEFKPVLGGLGIALGFWTGLVLACAVGLLPWSIWFRYGGFFAGYLIIVLVGLVDDVRGLGSVSKFSGEFVAAGVAVLGGTVVEAFVGPHGHMLSLGHFALPFSLLWFVYIINAVNLIDGLDGLAAGISLIALLGFALIAHMGMNETLLVMTLICVAAILGFLRFNVHPASIFMGDVGSLQLGYLLAFCSLEGLKVANSNNVYFLAALVLLGVPLTDTLTSFLRRLGRGENPFKPDREHIHHRLLKLGLTHGQTVVLMWLFGLFYMVLGVLMVYYREFTATVLFLLAFVFSLYWVWRLGYLESRQGSRLQAGETPFPAPVSWSRIWHQIWLLVGDLVGVNAALLVTIWFKFYSGLIQPPTTRPLSEFIEAPVCLLLSLGWILLFWLNGLYSMSWDLSRFDKAARITKVILFGVLVLGLITADPTRPFNRSQISTLFVYLAALVVLVNLIRLWIIGLEKRYRILEYSPKNTLLVGTSRKARNLLKDIEGNPHLLYRVVGVLEKRSTAREFQGYPIWSGLEQLPGLVQEKKIEEVIIALNGSPRQELLHLLSTCDRLGVTVKTLPELKDMAAVRNPELAGHALVRLFPEPMVLWQWMVKRTLDMLIAASILLLSFPFILVLLALVARRYGRAPLVAVPVLGKYGRPFPLYLIRISARDDLCLQAYQASVNRAQLDALGKFLYNSYAYKLPALWSVFIGHMSLVGPRPETAEWYRRYSGQLPFLHRRLLVRPGLTGLAQVKYRFDHSQRDLRERVKFDVYYVENLSLRMDLRILLLSLLLLIRQGNRAGKDE
ncbi:MAG: hypothetical protein D6715_07765 [Calditrichaeota bacterium]|nr:MAG: hypothetical protein D6715_07765 [Calditrichota bacterium]